MILLPQLIGLGQNIVVELLHRTGMFLGLKAVRWQIRLLRDGRRPMLVKIRNSELSLASIFLAVLTGISAADDLKVSEITPGSPYSIFYKGEPISFTIVVQNAGNIPSKVPLIVRQLRCIYFDALSAKEKKDVLENREQVVTDKVGDGSADATSDGALTKLKFTVNVKRMGAFRIFALIDGKEVKLADYLNILPPNNVPAMESVYAVSPPTNSAASFGLLARAGVKVVRWETGIRYKDGSVTDFDFSSDFAARELLIKNNLSATLIIGHDAQQFTPRFPGTDYSLDYANGAAPETQPGPARMPEFGRWCGEFAKVMKGPIRGYEFFNEPWEGGSISGATGGGAQVRRLILAGAPKIHEADPSAKCLAGCSIMNDEDSFLPYPDVMKLLDVLSIHTYLNFSDWSPAIASKLGKEYWATESWWTALDDGAPELLAHQIHRGYKLIEPMGGGQDITNIEGNHCTSGSATFITSQRFLDGMRGAGVAMRGHCPVILLFEGRGRAVAFLQSVALPDGSPCFGNTTGQTPYDRLEEMPMKTADYKPIGSYKVVAKPGLHVYDVWGNEVEASNGSITIPVGRFGYYVVAPSLDTLKSTLESGVLDGVKPFDLAIHDFTERLVPGTKLRVDVTNIYPEPQHADVTVDGGMGVSFESPVVSLDLKTGEKGTAVFTVRSATVNNANQYPITVTAHGAHGVTTLEEAINQAVIVRGTIKDINGDLSEWDALHPVPVYLSGKQDFSNAILAYQKLPFADAAAKNPNSYFVQAQAAYDDQYFYFAAKVNDPTENRRESCAYGQRCHTFAWPYQYLYMDPPEMTGYTGDTIILGFNTNDDNRRLWNYDMPDDPLYRDYPWPDTDYEFEVYPVKYNAYSDDYMKRNWRGQKPWHYPESEVWRLLDPKMVYRHHAYPFNPPTRTYDQGLVPGAKSVVKREGNLWIYEMAIPWSQIWELKPVPGSTFKFAFYTRDNGAHGLEYVYGKSVSVLNHSFHPTFEQFHSNDAEWGFEK